MNIKKILKWLSISVLSLVVLVIGLIVLLISLGQGFARPLLFELPSDYRGWILVEFSEPSCPPLATRGLYLVMSIPSSGQTCTSTAMTPGWRYWRAEYIRPDGTREKTDMPFMAHGEPDQQDLKAFVGPEHELNGPEQAKYPYPFGRPSSLMKKSGDQ